MTTLATAKRKGAETQAFVAQYFAEHGWPYATDAGAGRNGSDILGTPGLAIEVKARKDLHLPAWLRQASGEVGLPIVIHRPHGFGLASIADWPSIMRLADQVNLLRDAGYGDSRTVICEHVWPDNVGLDSGCERGCGLTLGEAARRG
jgi:hypothetical protein